jgi:hypothetical protein
MRSELARNAIGNVAFPANLDQPHDPVIAGSVEIWYATARGRSNVFRELSDEIIEKKIGPCRCRRLQFAFGIRDFARIPACATGILTEWACSVYRSLFCVDWTA